ncbi:MAG: 2-C-methyl-D-erythritol 4-phosphate cytidylyltransferase, partial [Actinomycetes bacterium]
MRPKRTSTTCSPSRTGTRPQQRPADPTDLPVATALVVAAGRGERLGSDGPKAFVVLGGRPMVAWCLDAFRAAPGIDSIVV